MERALLSASRIAPVNAGQEPLPLAGEVAVGCVLVPTASATPWFVATGNEAVQRRAEPGQPWLDRQAVRRRVCMPAAQSASAASISIGGSGTRAT